MSFRALVCLLAEAPLGDVSLNSRANIHVQLIIQQSYFLCWELLPDRNRKQWVCGTGHWWSHPDSVVCLVGTLHTLEWFWVSRRIFIYSHHICVFLYVRSCIGLFVSWGATGRCFVKFSRKHPCTIDYSTVLLLVLGVVTRQKLQTMGLWYRALMKSPWLCGTPSWDTPHSWMILSKQKNLHQFSTQYICIFLQDVSLWQKSVRSVSSTILARSISYLHIFSSNFRRCISCKLHFKIKKNQSFGKLFWFVTLTLSCFDFGSNMNQ